MAVVGGGCDGGDSFLFWFSKFNPCDGISLDM